MRGSLQKGFVGLDLIKLLGVALFLLFFFKMKIGKCSSFPKKNKEGEGKNERGRGVSLAAVAVIYIFIFIWR